MTDNDARPTADFDYRAKRLPRAVGIFLYSVVCLFFLSMIMGNAARLAAGGSIAWNTSMIVIATLGVAAFLRVLDSYLARKITVHPDRISVSRLFGETVIPFANAAYQFGSSTTPYGGATPQRTPMTIMESEATANKLLLFFRSTMGRHIAIHINLFTEEDKKRFFRLLADISGRPEPDLRMIGRWTPFYAGKPDGKK